MRLQSLSASVAAGAALCGIANGLPSLNFRKRDIFGPGAHTMRGNISEIVSWSGTSLAYAIVGSTPSQSDLQYLCTNFAALTTRYIEAFADPSGDVTAFAKSTICDAAKASALPNPADALWYLKSYLAGSFTVQTYYGNHSNFDYYGTMCYYLESSYLRGLWVPDPDSGGSGVDVEGSLCASAGWYDKGPGTTYTEASVDAAVQKEAATLVSEMFARQVQVLLKSDDQVEYVCRELTKYLPGLTGLGLDGDAVQEALCGNSKAVETKPAVNSFVAAMNKLFTFQLFNGARHDGYFAYLCQSLVADDLKKVLLDGQGIIKSACNLASTGTK